MVWLFSFSPKEEKEQNSCSDSQPGQMWLEDPCGSQGGSRHFWPVGRAGSDQWVQLALQKFGWGVGTDKYRGISAVADLKDCKIRRDFRMHLVPSSPFHSCDKGVVTCLGCGRPGIGKMWFSGEMYCGTVWETRRQDWRVKLSGTEQKMEENIDSFKKENLSSWSWSQ